MDKLLVKDGAYIFQTMDQLIGSAMNLAILLIFRRPALSRGHLLLWGVRTTKMRKFDSAKKSKKRGKKDIKKTQKKRKNPRKTGTPLKT